MEERDKEAKRQGRVRGERARGLRGRRQNSGAKRYWVKI